MIPVAQILIRRATIPRVAVEGYAGSESLDGVEIDVVVPGYVVFDGFCSARAIRMDPPSSRG